MLFKGKIYKILLSLVLLFLLPARAPAETFALVLANNAGEAYRKKEGDIITVRPADWEWGIKERQQYLVVLVDFGEVFSSFNELSNLKIPYYSDGSLIEPEMTTEAQPSRLAKRRYKISFSSLDNLAKSQGVTIDWAKVRDESVDYQPLLDNNIVFSYPDLIECKHVKRKLKKEDLDIIKEAGKKDAKLKLKEKLD